MSIYWIGKFSNKKLDLIKFVICLLLLFFMISCSENDEQNQPDDSIIDNNQIIVPNLNKDKYYTGMQIELYLNHKNSYNVYDYIDGKNIIIDDESIVYIQNNMFIPIKEGFTYVSFIDNKGIIHNYNLIVFDGAENVTEVIIDDISSYTGECIVGKEYIITTMNSSNCNISELDITLTSNYDEVLPEELYSVTNDGVLKVLGVGKCKLKVHSKTNKLDEGVTIDLNSRFESSTLENAINRCLSTKVDELKEENVYTVNELSLIDSLTFYELYSFDENTFKRYLPNLTDVNFDIKNNNSFIGEYTISSGDINYNFIGSNNLDYQFSIISESRNFLNLSFYDIKLNPIIGVAINISNVEKTNIDISGYCVIIGASGNDEFGSFTAITSKNLIIKLYKNAKLEIIGGNGTSSAISGNREGSTALYSSNDLSIKSIDSSSRATILIKGGNGTDGLHSGENGTNGGKGIHCSSLIISGSISGEIYGGNGGNGVAGRDGSAGEPGKKGNNESQGEDSVYGYNGRPGGNGENGQFGGSGGNGACAIYVMNSISLENTEIIQLCSGNGGNGSDGGDGGDGGRGGDGGDDDRWSPLWIGDMHGGEGGSGGSGGSKGLKGVGGYTSYPIICNSENCNKNFENIILINSIDGSDGDDGDDGENGLNGNKGDGGAGG